MGTTINFVHYIHQTSKIKRRSVSLHFHPAQSSGDTTPLEGIFECQPCKSSSFPRNSWPTLYLSSILKSSCASVEPANKPMHSSILKTRSSGGPHSCTYLMIQMTLGP